MNPQDIFEQWKGKQEAMGRSVPATTAPYYHSETPAETGESDAE